MRYLLNGKRKLSYHRRERVEKQDRKRTRRESVFPSSGETNRDDNDAFFPQGNDLFEGRTVWSYSSYHDDGEGGGGEERFCGETIS